MKAKDLKDQIPYKGIKKGKKEILLTRNPIRTMFWVYKVEDEEYTLLKKFTDLGEANDFAEDEYEKLT